MTLSTEDAGEFQRVVLTNSRAFFAVAFGILRNSHAAEDAIQDAVIKAWESHGSLREKKRIVAWLGRIVRNTALDHVRRRKMRGEVPLAELPAEGTPATRRHSVREGRGFLESALAALPEDQALIVHMRFADGLEIAEIALRLGITANAARVRLHRAVNLLRRRSVALPEKGGRP